MIQLSTHYVTRSWLFDLPRPNNPRRTLLPQTGFIFFASIIRCSGVTISALSWQSTSDLVFLRLCPCFRCHSVSAYREFASHISGTPGREGDGLFLPEAGIQQAVCWKTFRTLSGWKDVGYLVHVSWWIVNERMCGLCEVFLMPSRFQCCRSPQ